VRAIFPMHMFLIDEANVSFINQGRGLERVPLSLSVHISAGHLMKFVIDQRVQLVERSLVPLAPLGEQMSYFVQRGRGAFHVR